MKGRIYSSFEEVDKDLRILQLKRQIAREEIKGDFGDIKKKFDPPELVTSFKEGFLRKFFLSWLINFILRKMRK